VLAAVWHGRNGRVNPAAPPNRIGRPDVPPQHLLICAISSAIAMQQLMN